MSASEVMLELDHFVAKLDAYLSLAIAANVFNLNVKPKI